MVGRRPQWRSDDAYSRRRELFARAAPIFERFGYRGATLKALAAACGLSIPALYRYFPSKRAFALFPLPPLYPELQGPVPDFETLEPASVLGWWIEAAVGDMPNYLLAVRLLFEAGVTPDEDRRLRAALAEHADGLAAVVRRAAPALRPDVARRIASTMIEMTTGPAMTGLPRTPDELRRDLRALLRGYGIALPRP